MDNNFKTKEKTVFRGNKSQTVKRDERRRFATVIVNGVVDKCGDSWLTFDELDGKTEQITYVDEDQDEINSPEEQSVHYITTYPWKIFITCRKDKFKQLGIKPGMKLSLIVEPVIDWDRRLKKPVIKWWFESIKEHLN